MSIILALQISHKEVVQAQELCQLCADLEDRTEPRKDCEFWVVYSHKVNPDIVSRMITVLSPKFVARSYKARNRGEGFPYGANQLWLSTMVEVWGQYKHGSIFREAFNGIFTFEADCVPMRRDWIDALIAEWDKNVTEAYQWNKANPEETRPFEVMGHVHQGETIHKHINGNAIFKPDMLERKMIESHQHVGWDFWPPNRDYLLSVGKDTNLITQRYMAASISLEEMPFVKKNGVTPAVLHGVKDGSARQNVRTLLLNQNVTIT